MRTLALMIVAILATVAFFVGLWMDLVWLRVGVKPLPVLCLLGWVATSKPDRYGVLLAIGLGLSALGDLLLELPYDLFVFGLLAFLVAHLAYIAAAQAGGPPVRPLYALPFVVWCGGLYLWLLPGMGDLALPVGVYVAVIGTMLWRMAARTDATLLTSLALAGAISFAASDSLIALRKFSGDFTGAREAIMVLYWLGQILLASSAVLVGARPTAQAAAQAP